VDETPIIVHAAAIAKLSDPLSFLINGPMKEAHENEAKLSHLEVADFERICEFAYRGEYQVPSPINSSDAADGRDGDHSVDAGNEGEQEAQSTDASNIAGNLSQQFLAKPYLKSITPHASIKTLFSPQHQWDWHDDYTPVLLGHARLYTFGDEYLIPSLKNLALKKLHTTLAGYNSSYESREAVVELARYAYDTNNTPDRVEGKMNPLRELVVEFIVLKISDFKFFAYHRELLEEEGEYSTDVMDTINYWLL
jgi:hypothetical protein